MDRHELRKLLKDVHDGKVDVERAVERLQIARFEDLDFAKVDLHRAVRTGFPEVIYGPLTSTQPTGARRGTGW